jgi:hypothetical protein
MGANDRGSSISPEDGVACQSIELFEASSEIAADFDAGRTGGTPVVPRQVGIRCAHCATSPMASSNYSTVFPGSLGSIAANVRVIADNHLTSCRMAPPEIREACDRAAKRREGAENQEGRNKNEEEERSKMALLDYCVGFCQHMGIVNKQPHKTGISFADVEAPPGGAGLPPTPAETPAAHRGPPGAPYSGERMGPPPGYDHRMGYPTPGGPWRPGMPPMMGGPMGPGDAIAPTPLQRRRDRPGPEGQGERFPPAYSADRSEGPPPPSGFTPYSQGPPGSEGRYGVQTPAQPNFEGKEGAHPRPHSSPPSGHPNDSPPGYNHYDLPSNFPYYQESDSTWHCKFCSHVHPNYRDPQAIWSAPSGGPPPGNFIDSHLSMCRAYHQSVSPPMYQGPPPGYGAPFSVNGYPMPPHAGWDGHSPPHGAGMPPPHMQNPYGQPHPGEHYPYAATSGEPPPGYPGGPEEAAYGPPKGMALHGGRPGPPPSKEAMGDIARNSISHLVAREAEYYARNPTASQADRLVLDEDKLLLTDYFYHLMKQLRLCRFSESDRKTRGGKREKIKIGYGGLQCIHCADIPNSRKFFWSNVDRLANSFAEIPGHVLKCRRCPMQTKDALMKLKQYHPEQMARLPRGSQKVFFRRMWRRLHDEDAEANAAALADQSDTEASPQVKDEKVSPKKEETPKANTPDGKKEAEKSPAGASSGEESLFLLQRSTKEAAKALADSAESEPPASPSSKVLLAIPEDKEWLSDMDCYIRKQLEVFCAGESDVETAKSDRKYPVQAGQIGIRCIHCSMSSTEPCGTAVAFPFAINGIYEAVREFQRLHLDSCDNVPQATKDKLATFKGASSLSSVLRKYYILAANALGLQDTRDGIRSSGESVPLGSQAAFSFGNSSAASLSADEMNRRGGSFSAAESPAVPVKSEESSPNALETEDSKKRQEAPGSAEEEPPAKKSKADVEDETEKDESKAEESKKEDSPMEEASTEKPDEEAKDDEADVKAEDSPKDSSTENPIEKPTDKEDDDETKEKCFPKEEGGAAESKD